MVRVEPRGYQTVVVWMVIKDGIEVVITHSRTPSTTAKRLNQSDSGITDPLLVVVVRVYLSVRIKSFVILRLY